MCIKLPSSRTLESELELNLVLKAETTEENKEEAALVDRMIYYLLYVHHLTLEDVEVSRNAYDELSEKVKVHIK